MEDPILGRIPRAAGDCGRDRLDGPSPGRTFRAAAPFPAGTRLCRVAGRLKGAGSRIDDPFPIERIGERGRFPTQVGPPLVAPAADADPRRLWGCSHAWGPKMDYPPLWAAEDATEVGQMVRVEQRLSGMVSQMVSRTVEKPGTGTP